VKVSRQAAHRIAADVERRSGTCQATRDMTVVQAVKDWSKLGVRSMSGRALPQNLPDAAMVSGAKRHFLVYGNYDALLEYNCAHSYAISVALLSDRIPASKAR
jgi:membrane-bound lytic murein transglycosylase B